MLDSADVYVLLKVVARGGKDDWNQAGLAAEIGVSPSVVNRALKKAEALKLYQPATKRVSSRRLEEALVYGARYFLAPKRGGEVRGIATAWAVAPLAQEISTGESLPPVWPHPNGSLRGLSVEPLHPKAAVAASSDPKFYELLALVDVLRIGGSREIALAQKELRSRMDIGPGGEG